MKTLIRWYSAYSRRVFALLDAMALRYGYVPTALFAFAVAFTVGAFVALVVLSAVWFLV